MPGDLCGKFQGALIGTFAGDALGMPFEGWPSAAIREKPGAVDSMHPARLGAGTYTDDTEMAIGLAQVLAENGTVSPQKLADRFVDNFHGERGYGGGSRIVLDALARGVPFRQAAVAAFPEGSIGNGAAMRIAPVGVMFHHDPELLTEQARLSAIVTHVHPLAIEGATLQALAVGFAASGEYGGQDNPGRFIAALDGFVAMGEYKIALNRIPGLLGQPHDPETVAARLGNEVIAHRSVPAAIYCYLRFGHDFKLAVGEAVSLGGDTDTIGAMTGAICGAALGGDAVPPEWFEALENGEKGRDYVMGLGERLCAKWFKISA